MGSVPENKGTLPQHVKDWFGHGEKDVDLMLSAGVITEDQILRQWEEDPSGKVAYEATNSASSAGV